MRTVHSNVSPQPADRLTLPIGCRRFKLRSGPPEPYHHDDPPLVSARQPAAAGPASRALFPNPLPQRAALKRLKEFLKSSAAARNVGAMNRGVHLITEDAEREGFLIPFWQSTTTETTQLRLVVYLGRDPEYQQVLETLDAGPRRDFLQEMFTLGQRWAIRQRWRVRSRCSFCKGIRGRNRIAPRS
jgi:hypothetical protein